MAWLRALLPLAVAQSQEGMLSPVSSGPVSLRHARSAELELESPRRTRRAKRRMQPVCVMGECLPILTIQDPSDVQGAIVYDCRPPFQPVSLQLKDFGPLPLRPVVSASLAAPPWEDGMAISGVGPEGELFRRLVLHHWLTQGLISRMNCLHRMILRLRVLLSRKGSVFRGFVLRLRTSLISSCRRLFSRCPYCL